MILCQIILCEGGNEEFRFLVSALSILVKTFLAKTQFQNSLANSTLSTFSEVYSFEIQSEPAHICYYIGRSDYLSIDET